MSLFKKYPISKSSFLNVLFYLSIPIFVTQFSCKKNWLDEKTDKKLSIPTSLEDYELILDNTTLNGVSVTLGEIATDGHYINESSWTSISQIATLRNAYTWTKSQPYNNLADWLRPYQNIFYANVVLDGLKKIRPANTTELEMYNRVKGNALFHRSKNFFDLAQIFCPQYDSVSAKNDPGIPLKLEADITIPSTRSTVEKTYNQIIKDLIEATTLLPNYPLYKTRASRSGAYALLAKTYLQMGDYKNAFINADSSLRIYDVLIDYNSLNPSLGYAAPTFNPEVLFHCNSVSYPVVNSLARIDTSLFNMYDSNDLRRSIFFRLTTSGITYKGRYQNNSTAQLFAGLATDEVYLIRSECYVRMGNVDLGMEDLNALLRKRWKKKNGVSTYVDQTAVNIHEALVKIFDERKKELVLRCILWSDLRRLNKDERFKVTLKRSIGGIIYTLEPNSYKYTFPIPDDIVEISGMPQNIGW